MEIPAFFAAYKRGRITASNGYFSCSSVKIGDDEMPLSEAVSKGSIKEMRAPVVIVDCNSLSKGEFYEKVMMNMGIRGADVWLMTCIGTVEDVFDAFYKDTEMVLAPYHLVESDREWSEICEVSDSIMPVVFVHNGKAVLRNGKAGDVTMVLESLVAMGYYRNCVLDMEGSLSKETWSVIADDYPSTIPFVDGEIEGFQNTIAPFIF